jgi:hypothetical protein
MNNLCTEWGRGVRGTFFSVKGQIKNILGFLALWPLLQILNYSTPSLHGKVFIDRTYMNESIYGIKWWAGLNSLSSSHLTGEETEAQRGQVLSSRLYNQ